MAHWPAGPIPAVSGPLKKDNTVLGDGSSQRGSCVKKFMFGKWVVTRKYDKRVSIEHFQSGYVEIN